MWDEEKITRCEGKRETEGDEERVRGWCRLRIVAMKLSILLTINTGSEDKIGKDRKDKRGGLRGVSCLEDKKEDEERQRRHDEG